MICKVDHCTRPAWVKAKTHGMCQSHYRALIRLPSLPPCGAPGCDGKAEVKGYCQTHTARLRRTGSLTLSDRRQARYRASTGYIRINVTEEHPLKDQTGSVYEHRLVLFETIGFGPHQCHWCATHVNWRAGLEVDHLDADKANNNGMNLVPSCHGCNTRRALKAAS